VSGGVRHDNSKDFSTYNTYRIGSAYTIVEGLQFKINNSTAVKTPTLYELYGSDNYGYSGNPNLKPEEAITTDIGLSYNDSLTSLDIVYFTTDLDNAMKYQSSTYVNDTAKSNRHGVELNMARQLTTNLKTYSATTFTIAEDSDGNELTRRPKWINSTGLEHTQGQYTNIIELDYVGSHKDIDSTTYATIKKPSVSLTNFHSTYKIDDSNTISLSVKNIFDESYESPDGYSQPGRNWMITFKKNF
jgi:outer membrane cobalamin receptor